jgi:hypothetical protein
MFDFLSEMSIAVLQEQISRQTLVLLYIVDNILTADQRIKLAKIMQGEATTGIVFDLAKSEKSIPWDELTE